MLGCHFEDKCQFAWGIRRNCFKERVKKINYSDHQYTHRLYPKVAGTPYVTDAPCNGYLYLWMKEKEIT